MMMIFDKSQHQLRAPAYIPKVAQIKSILPMFLAFALKVFDSKL